MNKSLTMMYIIWVCVCKCVRSRIRYKSVSDTRLSAFSPLAGSACVLRPSGDALLPPNDNDNNRERAAAAAASPKGSWKLSKLIFLFSFQDAVTRRFLSFIIKRLTALTALYTAIIMQGMTALTIIRCFNFKDAGDLWFVNALCYVCVTPRRN